MLFEPSKPNPCTEGHALLVDVRMEPKAAAERPDVARTESSEASSISLLIAAMFRKMPGSIGGGVALPGVDSGNATDCEVGIYGADVMNVFPNDPDGGLYLSEWNILSRSRGRSDGRAWMFTIEPGGEWA